MSLKKRKFRVIVWFFPLAIIYRVIIGIRNKLFDWNILKSISFEVPVINVGNITVGGTGKTPHVEYLVRLLMDQFTIAVLSRGYKRKTKTYIRSTVDSTAEEIGDEPRQIKQKFKNVEIAVNRRRVAGIQHLKDEINDLQAIILDDAFQHRYVKPGLSILLVDYNRPILEDYLLPMGRLREHPYQRKRADIIIVTKCPSQIKPDERRQWLKNYVINPYQQLFFSSFVYDEPIAFIGGFSQIKYSDLQEKKMAILLVTGIANPYLLIAHLENFSKDIHLIKYPDHHNYTKQDVDAIANRFNEMINRYKVIITTEKDAVRLEKHKEKLLIQNLAIYYIPIRVEILFDQQKEFDEAIIKHVKSGKVFPSI